MKTQFFGKKDESGFTLVELLVVILIIGILAAIAIPMFLHQRKAAAEASVKSDLKSAAEAMETEYIKTRSYPATLPASVRTSDGVTVRNVANPWTTVTATLPDGTTADIRWHILPDTSLEVGLYTSTYTPISFSVSTLACSDANRSVSGSANLLYSSDPASTNSWMTVANCPAGTKLLSADVSFSLNGGAFTPVFTVRPPDPNPVVDRFCLEGFHSGDPTDVWRWNSADGGLAKGKC